MNRGYVVENKSGQVLAAGVNCTYWTAQREQATIFDTFEQAQRVAQRYQRGAAQAVAQ